MCTSKDSIIQARRVFLTLWLLCLPRVLRVFDPPKIEQTHLGIRRVLMEYWKYGVIGRRTPTCSMWHSRELGQFKKDWEWIAQLFGLSVCLVKSWKLAIHLGFMTCDIIGKPRVMLLKLPARDSEYLISKHYSCVSCCSSVSQFFQFFVDRNPDIQNP